MSGLDVDAVIDQLKLRKMPTEGVIKELCEKATAILGEEDNVQCVQAPVTICGDLHGTPPPAPPPPPPPPQDDSRPCQWNVCPAIRAAVEGHRRAAQPRVAPLPQTARSSPRS